MKLPRFDDVTSAQEILSGVITRTPLLRSIELDRITGGNIFVKAECLQLTGSFKIRGAFNRLARLKKAEKAKGVVAFSSGNHGQGIAYAAHLLGIDATIVMPETAPKIKVEKTRSHGAKIVLYNPKTDAREAVAAKISKETGAVVVPSFEDFHVIAGQGTAALEVVEDIRKRKTNLDSYLVCTGGGGLLAGATLVFKALKPSTKLYSVEPVHYDDHARSFAAKARVENDPNPPSTICDALLPPHPGDMTFAINRKHVKGGFSVTDEEVAYAMRFAFENLKIVAEPGGAAALAAVLAGKVETKGKNVGLIVTGGNVDPALFKHILG